MSEGTMPLDTFICGSCVGSFNDIEVFLAHKKGGCEGKPVELSTLEHPGGSPDGGGMGREGGDITQAPSEETELADSAVVTTQHEVTAMTLEKLDMSEAEGSEISSLMNAGLMQDDQQQTVIILQGDLSHLGMAGIVGGQEQNKPGKKRGRPKKHVPVVKQDDGSNDGNSIQAGPEIGKDGRFYCRRCKRSFRKERFFNTHKCWATEGYVDISQKEVKIHVSDDETAEVIEEAEEDEDAGALDMDDDEDYKLPNDMELVRVEKEDIEDEQEVEKLPPEKEMSHPDNEGISNVQVEADPDIECTSVEKATDAIADVPIFKTEEEKIAFENSLNVDLSGVDQMFRVHVIEQDLNENAPTVARVMSNALSLYSCNTCDKVFKTLSHMRLHCLIHTDLKPFKCPKCSYASNCRGNLYTHMRKHTGQYYKCFKCDFRSVNKSHLLEHESTHSSVRHPCELCQKTYNTVKSLVNHVRKYHDNERGKDYLQQFLQGREARGSTVIHQCHVCNRKFKKKTDRDRHLFIHDIKDIPSIQHCSLCDYMSSRKVYLDKHFQKHRVIYRCCCCDEKYLSTIRLIDHLTSEHLKTGKLDVNDLFEQSINNSIYLPEPDEALQGPEKELVNLPPELSSSSLDTAAINSLQTSQPSADLPVQPNSLVVVSEVATSQDSGDQFINKAADVISQEMAEPPQTGEEDSAPETMFSKDVSKNQDRENKRNITVLPLMTLDEAMKTQVTAGGIVNPGTDIHMDDEDGEAQETEDPNEDPSKEGVDMEVEEGQQPKDNKDATEDIIKRLGYLPMTMQIFQKMRDTFGNEECEYCGRLFYSKSDYEPHIRTHTGDKPYVCGKCGYRAITKDNLKRHTEKEHDNVVFPCPTENCDYIAHSRTQLWNHQMKHRGLKGLECPECQTQFESLKQLRHHVVLYHPDTKQEELQKITGIKHKIQGKMGRRSYKCPHCDKIFFRANSELQKHIWIHEGIKPFKCPICTYACRSKNNLQAHMLRHSTEKPFMCSECGKAYKSKTALRWHVRSHQDGKLFKCEKCPYEATQQSHLKRHIETHEVAKRFACCHCDFSANTIGYLKIHYTRFHKGKDLVIPNTAVEKTTSSKNDANIFKCLSCDYLFGNVSDLKRHLKFRHHVQVEHLQGLEKEQDVAYQVLQYEDPPQSSLSTEVVETTITPMDVQPIPPPDDQSNQLDAKAASAVNILQHIIDMSHQGAFNQQPIAVQSEDGQMVSINPETIIVQQEGQEVLLAESGTEIDGNQFVIQYVTPHENQEESMGMIEVQTEGEMQVLHTVTDNGVQHEQMS